MRPFAVYVHWPFCHRRCPYCDFNAHVRPQADTDRFTAALEQELAGSLRLLPSPVSIGSIFLGGGTPSRMTPRQVARLIGRVRAGCTVAPDCEITLEANPCDVTAEALAGWRQAGVNRLSIGVQSLEDRWLAWLGRIHSAQEAIGAVRLAAAHFRRWSLDLISARPGQTRAAWRDELSRAADLAGGHLSVYQLGFEPGTRFGLDHQRGRIRAPSPEEAAHLFHDTVRGLRSRGLHPYEISNFAASPADQCRHHVHVWRYGELLGVGPGAHGRVRNEAGRMVETQRIRSPDRWLDAVEASGEGMQSRREVGIGHEGLEALMLGLRLSEGVAREGLDAMESHGWLRAGSLDALIEAGFLGSRDGRVHLRQRGRVRLDAVLGHLV